MDKLIISPTPTSQWHDLVIEAKKYSAIDLTEDLESYLVFLLMRFTTSINLPNKIIALELLASAHKEPFQRQQMLRDIGDSCLLFAGLFPERAKRRCVSNDYYINIGRTAYGHLSASEQDGFAKLFAELCAQFVYLTNILNNMRNLGNHEKLLNIQSANNIYQTKH